MTGLLLCFHTVLFGINRIRYISTVDMLQNAASQLFKNVGKTQDPYRNLCLNLFISRQRKQVCQTLRAADTGFARQMQNRGLLSCSTCLKKR